MDVPEQVVNQIGEVVAPETSISNTVDTMDIAQLISIRIASQLCH